MTHIPIPSIKTDESPMKSHVFTRIRLWIAGILAIAGAIGISPAITEAGRDVLWEIVSLCLDPAAADYCTQCRWPRAESPCIPDPKCTATTEVWAESKDYAVIRDIKMCGCPEGYIHGLAIPRARVTGVEDPQRPNGIWQFAWDTAARKIGDPSAIALAVNPPGMRSQDQLHIHLVRLKPNARNQIVQLPTTWVTDLDKVWHAANQSAKEMNLTDYGIIVFSHPDGGFIVHVEKGSPEWLYTEAKCR